MNVLAATPTESGRMMNFLRLALREEIIDQRQVDALVALSKRAAPE